MRMEIPEDCCGMARRLIADGLDPGELLEFMRGDVVCLRGTARAFADRKLTISNHGTPVHRRLTAAERLAGGRHSENEGDPLAE